MKWVRILKRSIPSREAKTFRHLDGSGFRWDRKDWVFMSEGRWAVDLMGALRWGVGLVWVPLSLVVRHFYRVVDYAVNIDASVFFSFWCVVVLFVTVSKLYLILQCSVLIQKFSLELYIHNKNLKKKFIFKI